MLEGIAGLGQPLIISLKAADARDDGTEVITGTQLVNLFLMRLHLAFGHFYPCRAFQFFQAVAEFLVVKANGIAPADMTKRVKQRAFVFTADEVIGQPHIKRIGGIDIGGSQAQKEAAMTGHPRQKVAAADIGIKADGDFRHGDAGSFGDHPVRGTAHQAQAAAHDDAMAPDQHWFIHAVDLVIQAVLFEKESLNRLTAVVALFHGIIQRHYITAGTKGLFTSPFQYHHGDARVRFPATQLWAKTVDHRLGQGIEGFLTVQPGYANSPAIGGIQLFKLDDITHWFCHLGWRFSKKALTPSC